MKAAAEPRQRIIDNGIVWIELLQLRDHSGFYRRSARHRFCGPKLFAALKKADRIEKRRSEIVRVRDWVTLIRVHELAVLIDRVLQAPVEHFLDGCSGDLPLAGFHVGPAAIEEFGHIVMVMV